MTLTALAYALQMMSGAQEHDTFEQRRSVANVVRPFSVTSSGMFEGVGHFEDDGDLAGMKAAQARLVEERVFEDLAFMTGGAYWKRYAVPEYSAEPEGERFRCNVTDGTEVDVAGGNLSEVLEKDSHAKVALFEPGRRSFYKEIGPKFVGGDGRCMGKGLLRRVGAPLRFVGSSFGVLCGAFCEHSGSDSGSHGNCAEDQPKPSDRYLSFTGIGRVKGGIGGLPLRAKVGLSIFLPLVAATIWAWVNILFWDSRIGAGRLLAGGALACGLVALSTLFWS